MKNTIEVEPDILTANTYFWIPGHDENNRQKREYYYCNMVKNFLKYTVGMEVIEEDRKITAKKDNITVMFEYHENYNYVTKKCSVYNGEKKSNIRTLRKLYK